MEESHQETPDGFSFSIDPALTDSQAPLDMPNVSMENYLTSEQLSPANNEIITAECGGKASIPFVTQS